MARKIDDLTRQEINFLADMYEVDREDIEISAMLHYGVIVKFRRRKYRVFIPYGYLGRNQPE